MSTSSTAATRPTPKETLEAQLASLTAQADQAATEVQAAADRRATLAVQAAAIAQQLADEALKVHTQEELAQAATREDAARGEAAAAQHLEDDFATGYAAQQADLGRIESLTADLCTTIVHALTIGDDLHNLAERRGQHGNAFSVNLRKRIGGFLHWQFAHAAGPMHFEFTAPHTAFRRPLVDPPVTDSATT